jgi:hypothetical protein
MHDSTFKTSLGHFFGPTGDASLKRSLFTVAPDIPIFDAMENVSILLATVHASLLSAATEERVLSSDDAFMMAHTLKSAKAVVDSLIGNLQQHV